MIVRIKNRCFNAVFQSACVIIYDFSSFKLILDERNAGTRLQLRIQFTYSPCPGHVIFADSINKVGGVSEWGGAPLKGKTTKLKATIDKQCSRIITYNTFI